MFGSIVDAVDVVQRFLPRHQCRRVGRRPRRPGTRPARWHPGVTDVVNGPSAALVLAAYLAMFMAASAVLIGRRDAA
jgi:hypothetical protein